VGQVGDEPVPGDYLGTGHPQIAYYRPSTATWIVRTASGTTQSTQFGLSDVDIPVPGDYLALGRYQFAVYRPTTGEWFVHTDTGEAIRVQFGQGAPSGVTGDKPVPARYGARFGAP